MADLVDPEKIESIVGVSRRRNLHLARYVDGQIYIMHSQNCVDEYDDLRDCMYSLALDQGVEGKPSDQAQLVFVINEKLILSKEWAEIVRQSNEIFGLDDGKC